MNEGEPCGRGEIYFASIYGLSLYIEGLHMLLGLLQMAAVSIDRIYILFALVSLVCYLLGGAFGFLWNRAPWFRVSLVLQIALQTGCGLAAIFLNKPAASTWGVLGFALIFFLWSSMTQFCRKEGIPTDRIRAD